MCVKILGSAGVLDLFNNYLEHAGVVDGGGVVVGVVVVVVHAKNFLPIAYLSPETFLSSQNRPHLML